MVLNRFLPPTTTTLLKFSQVIFGKLKVLVQRLMMMPFDSFYQTQRVRNISLVKNLWKPCENLAKTLWNARKFSFRKFSQVFASFRNI